MASVMPLVRGRAVLIVEDDRDARELLEVMLQRHGHVVHAVETGEEGLELLRAHAFDAVLTDQNLPGMSGTDMLREAIASRLVTPDRAIICTAQPRVEDAGEIPVVTKPVDFAALARFVAERRPLPERDRAAQSGSFPQQ